MTFNETSTGSDTKRNPRLAYVIIFAVLGALWVFSGIMNLYLMNAAASLIVIEPLTIVFDIVCGALLLLSAFVVFKGKGIAIWTFSGVILVNIAGSLVMGRSVNFFVVLMGIVFVNQLFNLKKQKELS